MHSRCKSDGLSVTISLLSRMHKSAYQMLSCDSKDMAHGDLTWFGFGIKEVVTDLADTEEGLTLVGLCAALSATYDALFSAKVLRELYVLCKAPQSFTPALKQWKALVELCAGILTSAHLVHIANGFRQKISGYSPHITYSRLLQLHILHLPSLS